jgi:hypothetical protein
MPGFHRRWHRRRRLFLQRMMYEHYSLNTTNPAGIAGHAGNEILVSERSIKGLDTTRSV